VLDTLRIPNAVKGLGSVVATHVEVRGTCEHCAKEKVEDSVTNHTRLPQGQDRRRT
jgi:hypothetical protein